MEPYSDFRNKNNIEKLISIIDSEWTEPINVMEICGGHTHSIMRFGLNAILKDKINFLHGPGCPVCVMPLGRIDSAISLAMIPDVIIASYGDMMRVPGTRSSLIKERAAGRDVRMVYSPLDVLKIARDEKKNGKKVVFFAIGFETTTPMTAALIEEVVNSKIDNVFFYINHVLVPPPINAILDSDDNLINAFICPGHVSVISGSEIYEDIPRKFGKPAVIAGFEPFDILAGVLAIIRQIKSGTPSVEITYKRAVKEKGNPKARALVDKYFTVRGEFEWRGLGLIPNSGLRLKDEFYNIDAESVFADELKKASLLSEFEGIKENVSGGHVKAETCKCGEILKGRMKPGDCPLFGKICVPENPVGACMVSSEGACAAYYKYCNI